ncbi:MAG: hypothetical protein JWP75_1023 [Frondihabitans sp.]|nr:hypothetical protein [Frondihabitans sp.]
MRRVTTLAPDRMRALTWARRLAVSDWVAGVSVVLTAALLIVISLLRISPVFFGDEIGYLANSLALSGGPDLAISASSYYPGWSLVIAPLWWILHDPLHVYRAACLLSALSGILTIPVLTLLGRRLGVNGSVATIAACVVVALPGHALMSGFALAESFLGLVVAGTVLLAVVAAQTGRPVWFAAFGAAAGYAFVTHGRVVAMVGAAVAWGVVLVVRRTPRAGIAAIASTVIVAGSGYLLYHHLEVTLYGSSAREGDGIAKLIGASPGATALAGSGQLWFAVVSTCGLLLPGVVFIVRRIRHEWTERQAGWGSWLGLSVVGLAVVSVTYVSGSLTVHERLDVYVYGRYLEPLVDVVAFLGLVALVRGVSRRVLVGIVVAFVAITVGYGIAAARWVPTSAHTVFGWNPMNVFGLAQYGWATPHHDEALPVVSAACIVAVLLLATFVLRRFLRDPTWMLALLVGFALVSTIVGQARTVDPVYRGYQRAFTLTNIVKELPGATISFDTVPDVVTGRPSGVISRNAYQFFLAPRHVSVVDSGDGVPSTELTIARKYWTPGVAAGWRKIADDNAFDNALWVRPGALQTRLAAEGRLLPIDG